MIQLLGFTCYNLNASVTFDPVSATVQLLTTPIDTASLLCESLHAQTAIPIIQLGTIQFTQAPIVFNRHLPLDITFECPEPSCDSECLIGDTECRTCKEKRIKACYPASEANVAEIQLLFSDLSVEMRFSAGKYFVALGKTGNCLQDFSMKYSTEKLVFKGKSNMCPIQLTPLAIASQKAANCSEPIDNNPIDCPWVQIVLGGITLNVMPYLTQDLLKMENFEVKCSEVPISQKSICESILQQINELFDNEVVIQLAFAVDRNFGNETDLDMPISSNYNIFNLVGQIDPLAQPDCFESIKIQFFTKEAVVDLVKNEAAVNCNIPQHNSVEIAITGLTYQFFMLKNELADFEPITRSFVFNCQNAPNSTECQGNYTIALQGYRRSQLLTVEYLNNLQTVQKDIFATSPAQELFRNVSMTLFGNKFCMTVSQLSWASSTAHDAKFTVLMADLSISWRQQFPQTDGQYCQEISKMTASKLSQPCLVNSGILQIDDLQMPLASCENAIKPTIFWKQMVIVAVGCLGFTGLIGIIAFARFLKQRGVE